MPYFFVNSFESCNAKKGKYQIVIQVLQNWQQIHTATKEIQAKNLPLHLDIHKNWDHLLLYQFINTLAQNSLIIDLGCGDCCTLDFLSALGFEKLHGIDLKIAPNQEGMPYALHQGNIIKTEFDSGVCDVAVSISVIEHGVDLPAFFTEVSRLLKPGGLVLITTDYWSEKIEVDASIKPFGLEWKIFSRADIEQLIALAKENNLILAADEYIPACSDKPIDWHNYQYTFIALLFQKMK